MNGPELVKELRRLRDHFAKLTTHHQDARICAIAADTLVALERDAGQRSMRRSIDEASMRDCLRELWAREDPAAWQDGFAAEVERLIA